jgi:peptide/nickel transport system ATP-binding protein
MTAPVQDSLLRVEGLSKVYPVGGLLRRRRLHAVEDATFTVERGQIVSIVGESGSGKSTTARLIARLTPPSGGEIWFKGRGVVKAEPHRASLAYRRSVQMVFQDPFASLNPVHTVGHHLARTLSIHRHVRGRELRAHIHELLATVGLNPPRELAEKYPHQLSGGQRQRVSFARALAAQPELVLADEPVSMLDVSIRIGVLNLMARLKEELGIAYVYITHDLASARYIGDETIVMYAGYMVEGGESEELMARAAHPYTQLLLSAVPDPHSGLRARKLKGWENGPSQGAIGGDGRPSVGAFPQSAGVPSRIDPGPGCPFAGRCPHTMPVCHQVMPSTRPIGARHWVRCHLFEDGA